MSVSIERIPTSLDNYLMHRGQPLQTCVNRHFRYANFADIFVDVKKTVISVNQQLTKLKYFLHFN